VEIASRSSFAGSVARSPSPSSFHTIRGPCCLLRQPLARSCSLHSDAGSLLLLLHQSLLSSFVNYPTQLLAVVAAAAFTAGPAPIYLHQSVPRGKVRSGWRFTNPRTWEPLHTSPVSTSPRYIFSSLLPCSCRCLHSFYNSSRPTIYRDRRSLKLHVTARRSQQTNSRRRFQVSQFTS